MTHLLDLHFQTNNSSGTPNAGALLTFFQTTTTTPITVYQDSGKITPWTQPVAADASGLFPPIYVDTDTYKVVLSTSASVVIQTIDPVVAPYGTGQSKFADGTVSLPSITFTSDPDTGIWRVGANEIGITVGGLNMVDVTSTRVAINKTVTAPASTPNSAMLQTVANARSGLAIDVAGNAAQFPEILLRHARGTQASKTALTNGITYGMINFYGTGTTSYSTTAGTSIQAFTTEAWSGTAQGSSLIINTTANGTASAVTAATFEQSGALSIGTGINGAGWLNLAQGTTTRPPLLFTGGGALVTTAGQPGSMEYDGKAFYGGPSANQAGRHVLDAEQLVVATAAVTLSNSSTSAQAIFAAANDTLTLPDATTFFFEALIYLGTGATTHTTAFGLGGTATFTSIMYWSELVSAAATTVSTTCSFLEVLTANATVLNATSTAVVTKILLKGTFRINSAGTIIPQITFSAGPTGTCQTNINSYFRCWPVGSDTVAAVGAWA